MACIQQAQLPDLAEMLGLATVPEDVPAPVRMVTQQEQTELVVACLQDAGYEVTITGNGFGVTLPVEQGEAFDLTSFGCYARYPLLPQFSGPLSQTQLERVYAYFRDELIPCLADEGLVVEDVPSWETFLSAAEGGDLSSPYRDPSIMALGQAEWERLERVCPQMPSDDVLYAP